MDDDCPELIVAKVPVTILTGFLGSGKTTLLQYILTEEHQMKIAVIVNEFEFGKSIEKGLTVRSSEKSDDEWVELNNGCMCCSAQTQAVQALEKLMMKKGSFDLILIETSGLADPGPIAATFWQDDALCAVLQLSGIIAIADSKNISKYLHDDDIKNEVSRQILMADRVVLNKTDLVDEEHLERVAEEVHHLNPTASQVRTSFGKLNPSTLREMLFLNTTHDMSIIAQLPEHRHSSITSVAIEMNGMCVKSTKDVDFLCRDLLYHQDNETHPPAAGGAHSGPQSFEVVRCKAVIWCRPADDKEPILLQLQSIGDIFEVREMAAPSVPPLCNRFLILGRGLDKSALEAIIRSHVNNR